MSNRKEATASDDRGVVPDGAMPRAQAPRRGLHLRLIVAFLGVAVLPMLASTWFAVRVVSGTFDANVRHWLNETAALFLNVIREERDDAAPTIDYLVNDADLLASLVNGGKTLPPRYRQLIDLFGYDFLAVQDENGKVVFSSDPVEGALGDKLAPDQTLYKVTRNGREEVMVSGLRNVQYRGQRYTVMLGTRLDADFISHTSLFTSLDVRIYFRETGGYREFYSSLGGANEGPTLPPAVLYAFSHGATDYFDPVAEGGAYRATYRPIRNGVGDTVGVLFAGLRNRETLSGPLTQARLFVGVLLIGSVLAIVAAVAVARRMTTPLRQLADAAQGVADGDYRQVPPARGGDEIAHLTRVFNQMSAQLARLQDLEMQLRRRDRLSALAQVGLGIAHEVRNPLGIIRTSAELVQGNEALGEHDARLLGYVIEETRRIDHLISEFLAFARPVPLILAPVRTADIVERVAQVCEPQLAAAKIRLHLSLADTDTTISGDEQRLHEALLNLILNAVDAMPDGGDLWLRQFRHGDRLCVDVEDSGPGVSPEDQQHIFNPFFTTKAKGTGLGLAKAFAVMESHNGSIEYLGASGNGAMFRLSFPPIDTPRHA